MSRFRNRNTALHLPKKKHSHCSNVLEPSKCRRRSTPPSSSELLPGLPDDLALLCLARVPSLSLLWRVSSAWQAMVSHSSYFHSLRSSFGFKPQPWLYVLLHDENSLRSSSFSDTRNCSVSAFSWHAYDPISNSWHSLPHSPHPLDFHLSSPSFIGFRHPVQCASSASKLFMVAGSRLDKHREVDLKRPALTPALDCPLIFDTQTREWSEGLRFDVPRKWCVCGVAAEKLFVASGCGQEWDMAMSKSAQMYDTEVQKWVDIEGLRSSAFSRMGMNAANYNGKLHMLSGVGVIYNPATGKWEDMPKGMKNGWSGESVVVNGKLHVLQESSGTLKVYQEDNDEWRGVAKENEMLKHMEQLAGSESGMFCGIVRSRRGRESESDGGAEEEDVVRIVNLQGEEPMAVDLRPPFGGIVALQVLSRML